MTFDQVRLVHPGLNLKSLKGKEVGIVYIVSLQENLEVLLCSSNCIPKFTCTVPLQEKRLNHLLNYIVHYQSSTQKFLRLFSVWKLTLKKLYSHKKLLA